MRVKSGNEIFSRPRHAIIDGDQMCIVVYRIRTHRFHRRIHINRDILHIKFILVRMFIVNLNLNLRQSFTCIPGSHKLFSSQKGGEFSVENKSNDYKTRELTIKIPPNHCLLFFENIIHRISGKRPPKTPIMRKFVAFRLSDNDDTWEEERIRAAMKVQGPLPHKGGVVAPMYPRLWLTNWSDKLEAYSKRFRPCLLQRYRYSDRCKKAGREIVLPKRIPVSLLEIDELYELSDYDLPRMCEQTSSSFSYCIHHRFEAVMFD